MAKSFLQSEKFHRIARRVADGSGRPGTFILAAMLIVVWIVMGPVFHYSDTWQLVINTTTTIITFLMVFLIQNAQNRDSKSIHLKLDELIHGMRGARNTMLDLEESSEADLDALKAEFTKLRAQQGVKTIKGKARLKQTNDLPPS